MNTVHTEHLWAWASARRGQVRPHLLSHLSPDPRTREAPAEVQTGHQPAPSTARLTPPSLTPSLRPWNRGRGTLRAALEVTASSREKLAPSPDGNTCQARQGAGGSEMGRAGLRLQSQVKPVPTPTARLQAPRGLRLQSQVKPVPMPTARLQAPRGLGGCPVHFPFQPWACCALCSEESGHSLWATSPGLVCSWSEKEPFHPMELSCHLGQVFLSHLTLTLGKLMDERCSVHRH